MDYKNYVNIFTNKVKAFNPRSFFVHNRKPQPKPPVDEMKRLREVVKNKKNGWYY